MRSKLILLGTLILVLAAGAAIGALGARIFLHPHHPPFFGGPEGMPFGHPPTTRPWFYGSLNLTSDQQKKMDGIWEPVRHEMDKFFDERRSIEMRREKAVMALLTDEQRKQFDQIVRDYRAQRREMEDQRQHLIDDANQRSRALLDPDQQKLWDDMTRRFHDQQGRRGPMGAPGPPSRMDTTSPSGVPDGSGASH